MKQLAIQRLLTMGKGNSVRAQLVRGAMGVGGLKLLSLPISIASSILMARGLGVESYGLYTYTLALVSLVAFFSYAGLPQLLVREISKYDSLGEKALIKGIIRRSHQVAISLGVIFMVVFLSIAFFKAKMHGGESWKLLVIATVMIPITAITQVRVSILRGFRKDVESQLPTLILQPISFLIIASLLFLTGHLSPMAAIVSQIAAMIVSLVVVSFLIQRRMRARRAIIRYEDRFWMASLMPFSGIAAVWYINTGLVVPLVGMLGTSIDVAHFKVALSIAMLVSAPLAIVESVIHPQVARMYYALEITRLLKMTTKSGIVALIVSLPMLVIFIIYGQYLIDVMYGGSFSKAYYPMIVLAVSFALVNMIGPSMLLLTATTFEKDALYISLLSAIMLLVFCFLWIPQYGALGAAFAFAIPKLIRAIVFKSWANIRLKKNLV